MPRALLSVSDKTGIADLGRGLVARGFELVSTGGTARALTGAGLRRHERLRPDRVSRDDGRARQDAAPGPPRRHPRAPRSPRRPRGARAARYRPGRRGRGQSVSFRESRGKSGDHRSTRSSRRSTSAGRRSCGRPPRTSAACSSSSTRSTTRGCSTRWTPRRRRRSASTWRGRPSRTPRRTTRRSRPRWRPSRWTATGSSAAARREASALGPTVNLALEKIRDLRYGENPHQRAAWYREPGADGLGGAAILQGKELSFTNLLDLDAAARIALEFDEPAATVIKHTNPCGVATGGSPADAYVRARDVDRQSAFGGIVAINRPLDVATAEAIVSTFIEAVVAPSVEPAAREVLARRANMRVVAADFERLRRGGRRVPVDSRRDARAGARPRRRSAAGVAGRPAARRAARRDEARADGGGVAGAQVRVARVRARQVEHHHLHRRQPDAGDRRRADEPRRRGERGGDEGEGDRSVARRARWPPRTPFSRSATASTRSPPRARPRWSSRAGRRTTPRSIAAADEHGLAMVFTGRRHFRH